MSKSIQVSPSIHPSPWELSPPDSQLFLQINRFPKVEPKSFIVRDLKFVSDPPEAKERYFLHALLAKLKSEQNSVRIESPSYHYSHFLDDSLRELLIKKRDVTLMVGNSEPDQGLSSLVLLLLGARGTEKSLLNRIKSQGARILYLQQKPSSQEEICPQLEPNFATENKRFTELSNNTFLSNHGKAIIFDDQDVILGSFNFDVLSEIHNVEAGFYFEDGKELASYLKGIQEKRNYKSYL